MTLTGGRVYDEDVDDERYRDVTYTSEYAVLQGERWRPQPSEPPSLSAAPPHTALRFPVAFFHFSGDPSYDDEKHKRGHPSLRFFYHPHELSLHLWQSPDGLTEGDDDTAYGNPSRVQLEYEPMPADDDDPLPRLVRATQVSNKQRREATLVAVFHSARRLDWTAEAEQKDRRWQAEQVRRARWSRARAVHLVLSRDEEQRICPLIERCQACHHPSRSQDTKPEPYDDGGPPRGLMELLKEVEQLMSDEQAVCSVDDLYHKYWA